jgi:sugar phosphate permease
VSESHPRTAGSARADRTQVAVFGLSWISYASYYLCRKNFGVAKARISTELGASTAMLAAIDTGYLGCYALGQFLCGWLGDRVGPRRLVGAGMIASAALVAAMGVSGTPIMLLALFALNGVAQSSGWPGNVKAMAAWFGRERRGRVMGIWSTCYQVGGLAGTALATWLLVRHGWRAAFVGPAVGVAIVGGAVLLRLPERAAPDPRGAPSASVQFHVLRSPLVWSLAAAYFCLKLVRYSLLFWLPFYLHRRLGYDEGTAGYLSTSFEVGGVLGAVAAGFASDTWAAGRRGAVSAAMCAALAGALALYIATARLGIAVNFTAMALVGFCLFGPDALISGAAAQDLGDVEASATTAGVINGLGSVGAVLQGVLTAAVSARYGWDRLFGVFVALAVVAALALVPLVRADRQALEASAAGGST